MTFPPDGPQVPAVRNARRSRRYPAHYRGVRDLRHGANARNCPPNMQTLAAATRLIHTGQLVQAQALLERLVRANPELSQAHWLLANVLLKLGDPVSAERAIRGFIRLDGETVSSLALLGEILDAQGRTADAADAFRQALACDPGNASIVARLATILLTRNRIPEALELIERFISQNKETPALLLLRAQSLLAIGDHQRAIPAFRKAADLLPDSDSAWIGLAAALADDGQHVAAETAVKHAATHGHDNAQTRFVLARVLLAQRRYEEAEAEFRNAIRLHPGYVQAHINLAETLWMHTGDAKTVSDEIDASLRTNPALSPLRLLKAKLLEASGDSAAALAEMDSAIERDGSNLALHVAASQIAVKCDADRALRHARLAMQLGPDNPTVLGTYGNALLASGHAAEADALAGKLLAINSLDGAALALRATAWRMLGDQRYRDAYDYGRFVRPGLIDTPDGWPNLSAYLDDLSLGLLELHAFRTHPIGQSLRHGTQADLALKHANHPAVRAFAQAIDGPIRRYMQAIGHGSDPLRQRNTGRYKLRGAWSVRLRPNGYHFNHFHPEGWLSSACYIHLPAAVSSPGGEGWLQFGEPAFPTRPPIPPEYFVRPEPGLLVLFPSWFWHGTVPFSGPDDDYRLTIAFDVVPG